MCQFSPGCKYQYSGQVLTDQSYYAATNVSAKITIASIIFNCYTQYSTLFRFSFIRLFSSLNQTTIHSARQCNYELCIGMVLLLQCYSFMFQPIKFYGSHALIQLEDDISIQTSSTNKARSSTASIWLMVLKTACLVIAIYKLSS